MESDLKITYTAIFFALLMMGTVIFITSCSYSITQVQTRGNVSDVVDDTETNTPCTSLTIPAAVL
jgi:hypothetical protein